eukprot:5228528-Prymnesium_polylepis.1
MLGGLGHGMGDGTGRESRRPPHGVAGPGGQGAGGGVDATMSVWLWARAARNKSRPKLPPPPPSSYPMNLTPGLTPAGAAAGLWRGPVAAWRVDRVTDGRVGPRTLGATPGVARAMGGGRCRAGGSGGRPVGAPHAGLRHKG